MDKVYRITEYDPVAQTWKIHKGGAGARYRGAQRPRVYTELGHAKSALRGLHESLNELSKKQDNPTPQLRIEESEVEWYGLD